MPRILIYVLFSALIFSITCCKKKTTSPDDPAAPVQPASPTDKLLKLGEVYLTGANAKAILYASKALTTGYNDIYIIFNDSADGSKLTHGLMSITGLMDMGNLIHTCPVENSTDTLSTDGLFHSAIVFTMAGNSQQWLINVSFQNNKNHKSGTGSIGVSVIDSNPLCFKSTVISADNNATVLISLIQPQSPKVGINDIEFVFHKETNTSGYLPIEDYTVEIEPNMPSMGHGSPNNVNPVHTANGHYKGKVNFTMTGLWQIKLKLYKNGTLISSDLYFETTLQ